MKATVWGARGSVPAPGPETNRYGGNTSCVHVSLDDGTGIRCLGLAMKPETERIHILLTHLHMDHIQGLMFFAPLFRPETDVVIYGPASPEASIGPAAPVRGVLSSRDAPSLPPEPSPQG